MASLLDPALQEHAVIITALVFNPQETYKRQVVFGDIVAKEAVRLSQLELVSLYLEEVSKLRITRVLLRSQST